MLIDLDLAIFHWVNFYSGRSFLLDQFIYFTSINNLVKAVPFAALFCVMWFRPQTSEEQRKILIAVLLAVVVALIINRGLSSLLPFRARPMVTPDIGFREPFAAFVQKSVTDNWSSFPSDHAAMFFAMAIGFWFISRWLGFVLTIYSCWIAVQRIYLGEHYPSDVFVGALIGTLSALAICSRAVRDRMAAPVLNVSRLVPVAFNVVFFLFLFELGNMFQEVRQIAKGGAILLRHYFA